MSQITLHITSKDVALELMVHHLQIAEALYQTTPGISPERDAEIKRLVEEPYHTKVWKDDGGLGKMVDEVYFEDSPEAIGTRAFVAALDAYYEKLRLEDEEA